jgi:protein-tyrosine phosphatase
VGDPVAPHMADLLDRSLPGFSARQVTPRMIGEADLVLGMTREHRAALVTLSPASVRRTFTLREFAELAVLAHKNGLLPPDGSPGRRLASAAEAAPRFRGQRTVSLEDDVEDPYGRDLPAYARAMEQIAESLGAILRVVRD